MKMHRSERTVFTLIVGLSVVFLLAASATSNEERTRYEGDCVFCWIDGSAFSTDCCDTPVTKKPGATSFW